MKIFGTPESGALMQAENCLLSGANIVCLMADNHKGYSVPIGGVVAYRNAICPQGVGYDIACGNKAILTYANANDVRKNI
jgi:tRNA-splicing ligase RtcB